MFRALGTAAFLVTLPLAAAETPAGVFPISEHGEYDGIDEATPAAASNGQNSLMVWKDNRNDRQPYHRGRYQLYGRRFDLAGRPLDPTSFPLQDEPFVWNFEGITQPSIAVTGRDYLVVWVTRFKNVSARRVLSDGTVMTNEIQIARTGIASGQPAVAASRRGSLVAWTERTNNNGNIFAALLDRSGRVTRVVPIATNSANTQFPTVASDGKNYLLLWRELATSGEVTVSAARVSQGGQVHYCGQFPLTHARGVTVASNGRNYFVALQSISPQLGRDDLMGCVMNPRGHVTRDKLPIALGIQQQSLPALLPSGRDFTMLWRANPYLVEAELFAVAVSRQGTALTEPTPVTSPAGWRGYGTAASTGPSTAVVVLEQKTPDYDYNGYLSRVRATLVAR